MLADNTARGPAERSRSDVIQVLRFVAAALVVVTHSTFYFHERIDPELGIWHGGEVGVQIFFVISGMVIVMSSAALAHDRYGAREFMARRLLRILPLYWLVTLIKIGIALAVPAVVLHNHFDVVYAIKSLLFIPVFNAAGELRPIHGVGWTLFHEMFFYLVYACAMLCTRKAVLVSGLLIAGLCAVGHVWPQQTPFGVVATSPINLHFVLGMSVGAALARSGLWQRALLALLLLLALVRVIMPGTLPEITPVPLVLVLAGLMLVSAAWRTPAALRWPVALGDSSYALYLFHPMIAPAVLLAVQQFAPGLPAAAKLGVAILSVIVLAHVIHLQIERPLTRWARRATGRRANVLNSSQSHQS